MNPFCLVVNTKFITKQLNVKLNRELDDVIFHRFALNQLSYWCIKFYVAYITASMAAYH